MVSERFGDGSLLPKQIARKADSECLRLVNISVRVLLVCLCGCGAGFPFVVVLLEGAQGRRPPLMVFILDPETTFLVTSAHGEQEQQRARMCNTLFPALLEEKREA